MVIIYVTAIRALVKASKSTTKIFKNCNCPHILMYNLKCSTVITVFDQEFWSFSYFSDSDLVGIEMIQLSAKI